MHCSEGLLFEGCSIRCGYGSQILKYRQSIYFEVNQSLNEALGGFVYFPISLDELLQRCSPSVEVALGSIHNVAAILHPTTFPVIEVESSVPGQSSQPRISYRSFAWTRCISEPGCMHLMEYLCRPKHIAVVIALQLQLHSVNGRNASGGPTMRPLSSTAEDLGMKTVLLAANSVETAQRDPQARVCTRQTRIEIPTLPHTSRYFLESHRVQERILSV